MSDIPGYSTPTHLVSPVTRRKPRPALILPAKVSSGVSRLGERASVYARKLKILREVSDRFDAKKLDALYVSKPRTAKGKAARAAALKRVASTFQKIKPFVHRSRKVLKPRAGKHAARNLEELRKYAGFVKIKGLRGVPLETYTPKNTRVKFDSAGRPTISVGKGAHKFFRFPHMPRSGDEVIAFVKQMLDEKTLPAGIYILASRHAFLIGGGSIMAERDALLSQVSEFVHQYEAQNPEFIKLLFGLKWVAGSGDRAFARMENMRSERGRQKQLRHDLKAERAAREIRDMHRKFTGERLPVTQMEKNRKAKIRLSERARKTGRR